MSDLAASAGSSSVGQDSVSALPASSSRKAAIRGHRPSVLGGASIDMSDESRDTVEMKDSDQWYPQFSPSAALPKAQKISGDKQTGQRHTRERERAEQRRVGEAGKPKQICTMGGRPGHRQRPEGGCHANDGLSCDRKSSCLDLLTR